MPSWAWKEQAANLKQGSKRVHEAVQVLNTKGHVDDCIETRGVRATKVANVGPHIARGDSQGFDLAASAVVQQNNCQGIQVHLQQPGGSTHKLNQQKGLGHVFKAASEGGSAVDVV